MTIGERIKYYRTKKNLTQAQLGGLTGIPASMIGQYEIGARKPKLEKVRRIATALNISPWDILGIPHTLGGRIASVREAAGFSQEDFAKRIGVSVIDVQLWESNEETPSMEILNEMSYAVEIDVSYFTEVMGFSAPVLDDENFNRIQEAYKQLNDLGQLKAMERVEELTEIPKYQAAHKP